MDTIKTVKFPRSSVENRYGEKTWPSHCGRFLIVQKKYTLPTASIAYDLIPLLGLVEQFWSLEDAKQCARHYTAIILKETA